MSNAPVPPPIPAPTCPHCGAALAADEPNAVCSHCGRAPVAPPPVMAPPVIPPPPPRTEPIVRAPKISDAPADESVPQIDAPTPNSRKPTSRVADEAAGAPRPRLTAEQKARLRRKTHWVIALFSAAVLLAAYCALLALS